MRDVTIFNDPNQTLRRRALRAGRPPAERLLWRRLTGRQVEGFRFRRQQGIGPYFLDFYCVEVRLPVEIDGASHDSEAAEVHDERRRVYLESLGILTIRFLNQEVMASADVVAEQIGVVLLARRAELGVGPPLAPPPSGGGTE
jgi:very-short-patch-repair endonuclease